MYLPFPDYKGADITKGFNTKPTCHGYGLSAQRQLVKTRKKKPEVFGAMETEQLTNVLFLTSAGIALEPVFQQKTVKKLPATYVVVGWSGRKTQKNYLGSSSQMKQGK